MPNTAITGVEPWSGRARGTIVDHTGPTSYTTGGETLGQNVYGGPNVLGLAGFYKVDGSVTASGNFKVECLYGGTGIRSSIKLIWSFTNYNGAGVASVTDTGGSGMTVGTYPLVFSGGGGTGATGTITVTSATASTTTITNPGSGYTSAPTVTAATGGTPPTFTAVLSSPGLQVSAGTNLSGETAKLMVFGG